MEDRVGATPDDPVTLGPSDGDTRHRVLTIAAVGTVAAAVPVLWLELVPFAWAAPFVLIYLVVLVPLVLSEGRRRRRLL